MKTAPKPIGVRGSPDPAALRRTGKRLHILLTAEEYEAARRDAIKRAVSINHHIRDLLEQWRRRK